MAGSTKLLLLPLLFLLLVVFDSATAFKTKVAKIQFYMHDTISGPHPSTIQVARRLSHYTGSDPIVASFGSVYMMDNPLTATPQLNSTLIGRGQGLYALSSQHDELTLHMSLTFWLMSGPYNGSTFSVVARNPIMHQDRELPVLGGTGRFRLARGYCLLNTFSTHEMDAVIGYNVTLLHY